MLQLLAQSLTTNSLNTTLNNTTVSSGTAAGILVAGLVIGLVVWLFYIIVMWQVFKKAGRPGWAAIIPVYNTWVLFEISGKPGWWALIVLLTWIPLLGWLAGIAFFVLYIMAMLELAKRFGKDTVFAVLGLILFSFVGFIMLAFGKAQYKSGSTPAATNPKAPASPTPAA